MGKTLITEADVDRARRDGGALRVEGAYLVTPGAQDRLLRLGIVIETVRPGSGMPRPDGRPRVALAADHGGFDLKEDLKQHLASSGYSVLDFGTTSRDSVDYPDFAHAGALAVQEGTADRAILIDGAGIGSSMVANKLPGIRAAKCDSMADVENSRLHNDANVLTLSGRLERSLARDMARRWLEAPFEGGRHARRVEKIAEIENRYIHREVRHGRS